MNNCDIEELRQIAVKKFLSIPDEDFKVVTNRGAWYTTEFDVGNDTWAYYVNCDYSNLSLNGATVVHFFCTGRNQEGPDWAKKAQRIIELDRTKKLCLELEVALGIKPKPEPKPEWPKRKWWQFRK